MLMCSRDVSDYYMICFDFNRRKVWQILHLDYYYRLLLKKSVFWLYVTRLFLFYFKGTYTGEEEDISSAMRQRAIMGYGEPHIVSINIVIFSYLNE